MIKIYNSLPEAIEALNSYSARLGEEIKLFYYTNNGDSIDILLAVGTKNGIGPGSYSIVSTNSIRIVEFVTILPDSSHLVNGKTCIFTDKVNGNKNYLVYLTGKNRTVMPVESELFVSSTNGDKYYVTPNTIKKFSELVSKEELLGGVLEGRVMLTTEEEYQDYNYPNREETIFIMCKPIE